MKKIKKVRIKLETIKKQGYGNKNHKRIADEVLYEFCLFPTKNYLVAFTVYFVVNLKCCKVEKVCILRHCMDTETQIALKLIKYKYDIHAYLQFFFTKQKSNMNTGWTTNL